MTTPVRKDSGAVQNWSETARRAAQTGEWRVVKNCSARILERSPDDPEGHFLLGVAERGSSRPHLAVTAFERALKLDPGRYDAAVELASQYVLLGRHADALKLLETYACRLGNSPIYLDVAATTYCRLGFHERAQPLYEKASALQPGVDLFQANLAACNVNLGRIEEAKAIYRRLLERSPTHQRNHYELSRLQTAPDISHVQQMKALLRRSVLPSERNIFLYYAIGKELEDLEQWDEAFHYYELAGNAAARLGDYDVRSDLEVMDALIEVCTREWLNAGDDPTLSVEYTSVPIFIVGLPRSGTTLVERIISSHSQVESLGETFFMQSAVQKVSGLERGRFGVTPQIVLAMRRKSCTDVVNTYMQSVAYRLAGRSVFIDKLPENILYLGFIAKGFRRAHMVHVRRHPMDVCFAMYKQSFFRYAYRLDDLATYYVAYDRLQRYWKQVLGERLTEVNYEQLISDQEGETRKLLARLGLGFETACLEFERNPTAVATASSAQVREKVHSRSVGKWRHFARHLEPLKSRLKMAGIEVS